MLDPADSEEAQLIHRKMRYRTDSGLLFAWVKGPNIAEIGADLTPLYAINFGAIQRVIQRPDGGFDITQIEVNFITDPDTGKRIDTLHNPITKDVLPVPLQRPKPFSTRFSRDNRMKAPAYQGANFEATSYPVGIFTIGDDLFVRDRTRMRLSPQIGPARTANEISTFSAPRALALDPKVAFVETRLQANEVSDWPSWLNMRGHSGVLSLFGVGGKVSRLADMPQDWLEMLQEVWPDIAADPIAALKSSVGPSSGL